MQEKDIGGITMKKPKYNLGDIVRFEIQAKSTEGILISEMLSFEICGISHNPSSVLSTGTVWDYNLYRDGNIITKCEHEIDLYNKS